MITDGAKSVVTGDADIPHWPEQTYRVNSTVDFHRMREIFFADSQQTCREVLQAACGLLDVTCRQRFLRAGMIDRMIITRVPVLIGEGIPLFGALPHDIRLRHVSTRHFPSGLVQTEYRVA